MSSYDVAIVMDSATLDKGVQGLYTSQDKDKIFSGIKNLDKATVEKTSVKSVNWSIDASPTFTLSPPTQAQWDDPKTFYPDGKDNRPSKPPANMLQVTLSQFSTTINYDKGDPEPLSFSATIFVEAAIKDNKVELGPVAILPANVSSDIQLVILDIILAIAYKKGTSLLAGYTIPNSIDIKDQEFTPPVVAVTDKHLIVASNLVTTGAPDIAGVTWPEQSLAVLTSRNLMKALVSKFSAKAVQKIDGKSFSHSDSNWAGSYSIDGGISHALIEVDSTLPDIDVSATISANASLGVSWWLIPGACAMEAASNLL